MSSGCGRGVGGTLQPRRHFSLLPVSSAHVLTLFAGFQQEPHHQRRRRWFTSVRLETFRVGCDGSSSCRLVCEIKKKNVRTGFQVAVRFILLLLLCSVSLLLHPPNCHLQHCFSSSPSGSSLSRSSYCSPSLTCSP